MKIKTILAALLFSTATIYAVEKPAYSYSQIQSEQDPNQFINMVTSSLFYKLKVNQDKIPKNPNLLKEVVQEELIPYFNVKYAGSLILGSNYQKFSDTERNEFFSVLEQYIITNYAQIFTLYKNQEIKLIPIKYDGGNMVKARIDVMNGTPVKLSLALRKNSKTGYWQGYDLTAEGISFVESKKQEWSKSFKDNTTLRKLIEDLRELSKKNIVIK